MLRHAAILLFLTLLAQPAFALRCGSKLVNEGDYKSKVLHYCGKPTAVERYVIWRSGFRGPRVHSEKLPRGADIERHELLYPDRSAVEVVVEEWTYNLGPHKLMRLVRFENGFVTDITRLGYGYRE